jgi:C4-dicarboxylate transporter DctM subunit
MMVFQLLFIIGLLIFAIFSGAPVMAAIGCTACISMAIFMEQNFFGHCATLAYEQSINPNMIIAPLFILMANFLAEGGIASDIFSVMHYLLKKVKGGLAMATTLTCTLFAAMCGSSPATAASVGQIAVDSMTSRGYRKDLAIGTVGGGGTLGIMIPPSITMVGFGLLTETSIVKLLMAGLIPGLMLSALMVLSTAIRVRFNPALIGHIKETKLMAGRYDKDAYAVDLHILMKMIPTHLKRDCSLS